MDLRFPPLSGGTVSGLNDAGIETFEGDFARNVVRECAQNSLDAAASADHSVELRINRLSIPSAELPFMPALRDILGRCGDYWNKHDKAKKFFATALTLAGKRQVDAVKISDFGTTGVDGEDDDTTGRWFGLVKSRGVSNQKGADGGGAFGIGKDAPLAGSPFRTVLYSTRTADGKVALQGVCRLVTHKDAGGESTQGTGFIGEFDFQRKLYRAIRDPDLIPQQFLRTETGLDVWIIGSRHLDEPCLSGLLTRRIFCYWSRIMNPDPTVFARYVLWNLSDLQAQVYHNQLLLIELLARQTNQTASQVQSMHSADVERMRLDRYHEALDAVGIDRGPDQSPEQKRF